MFPTASLTSHREACLVLLPPRSDGIRRHHVIFIEERSDERDLRCGDSIHHINIKGIQVASHEAAGLIIHKAGVVANAKENSREVAVVFAGCKMAGFDVRHALIRWSGGVGTVTLRGQLAIESVEQFLRLLHGDLLRVTAVDVDSRSLSGGEEGLVVEHAEYARRFAAPQLRPSRPGGWGRYRLSHDMAVKEGHHIVV